MSRLLAIGTQRHCMRDVEAAQPISGVNQNQDAARRASIPPGLPQDISDVWNDGARVAITARENPVQSNSENPLSRHPAVKGNPAVATQSTDRVYPELNAGTSPGRHNSKNRPSVAEVIQARFTPAKESRVWDIYVNKTEQEDRDLIEDWDRMIDVTLVFAALFSAISTGFVLESSKNLKFDQSKATVLAIQELTRVVQAGLNGTKSEALLGSSIFDSADASFKPTFATILVNCLWFLSLGLSISISLLAMLAKRWCYAFRSKLIGTSYERTMNRHEFWDTIMEWKIDLVIEQLPTLMHVALGLFFLGLVVYLSEIHQAAMIVTTILLGFILLLYCTLTVLPLWYPNLPLVTPFTRILIFAIQCFNNPTNSIKPFDVTDPLEKPLTRDSDNPDWVMEDCLNTAACRKETRPPAENSRHALGALTWVLDNCTDRGSIQEVFEHVLDFPEVVLDSSMSSNQLYRAALKAAEHLHRFLHDSTSFDGLYILRFNALCLSFVRLITRPWLHEAGLDPSGIMKLPIVVGAATNVIPNELYKQITAVTKETEIGSLPEPVLWMEDLAWKIVFGCETDQGLHMCAALWKALLNDKVEPRPAVLQLNAELHSTLWWILLCNGINSAEGCWPLGLDVPPPGHEAVALPDNTLVWNYFRDSKKRQENNPWLSIVGISGVLYAFTCFPDHEDGPTLKSNEQYFEKLIGALHSSLRVSHGTVSTSGPFIGEFPVYCGGKIRLHQFDSLDYAFDALGFVIDSPAYRAEPLLGNLRLLRQHIGQFKHLRGLFDTEPGRALDYIHVGERFGAEVQVEYTPDILLNSGLRCYVPDPDKEYRLTRKWAKLLSKVLPSVIFGVPDTSLSPKNPEGHGRITQVELSDNYIEASDKIAAWAWMPFHYDSRAFRKEFQVKNLYLMDVGPIWQSLQRAGLLQIPLGDLSTSAFRRHNDGEYLEHGYGYCLHIKASLLERLYSFPSGGDRSPDIPAWSIAVSKQIVVLLQFWDKAGIGLDKQTYIITSLMRLVHALFEDASDSDVSPRSSDSCPHSPTLVQANPSHALAADDQLKQLVESDIISILSSPFSGCLKFHISHMSEQIPDEVMWREDLARLIDKLARKFPHPQGQNANLAYSNLVTYYKAQARADSGELSSMLDLVTKLRDDMAAV